jgi:UDP-2,4-diacetamido-2,4,6-trideoxy-beta-L-altropyranose hydrolase
MKFFLFRVDASPKIGLGHLIRCRVIAKKLLKRKVKSVMLGPSKKYQNQQDKKLFLKWIPLKKENILLETKKINYWYKFFLCSFLILDIYKVPITYQKKLVSFNIRWLTFSNKHRSSLADIVLNLSPGKTSILINKLINKIQITFKGHQFSLLRDQFYNLPRKKKSSSKKNIFICFGGGNDNGLSLLVIKYFKKYFAKYNFVVAVSKFNSNYDSIKKFIQENNCKDIILHKQQSNIANLIDQSSFAIISGGTISHEVNSRGKKMLIICTAKNQIYQSKKWVKIKKANYLGYWNKKNFNKIKSNFEILMKKNTKFLQYNKKKLFLNKNSLIINEIVK